MIKQFIVICAAVSALSLPAFAATEFYVGKDDTTKKCMVVDKKPDGTMMKQVGTAVYDTKAKAEEEMAKLADCKA